MIRPQFIARFAVPEGPPAPSITLPIFGEPVHFYELSDLGGRSVGTYFVLRDALDALKYDWPARTVLILRRWIRGPSGRSLDRAWYAHWGLSGKLYTTRIVGEI